MDALKIIKKFYTPGSLSYKVLVEHGSLVAEKSRRIALRLKDRLPDMQFMEEAAMLHDIGMFLTNAPAIGCYGEKPYICHGYLGREILDKEGFPLHALVCERHVGVGLTVPEIRRQNLPLPLREMVPVSIEEQIICFADKFFSKNKGTLSREKTIDEVRANAAKYGRENLERFEEMVRIFDKV